MRTSVTGSSLPPVSSLNAGRMIGRASPASRRRRPARRRHLRSRTGREADSRRAPGAGTHPAQPPSQPRQDRSRAGLHERMVCEDLIYLAAPRMADELASDQTVRTRLEGISAVPVTPFDENGGVDEAAVSAVSSPGSGGGPRRYRYGGGLDLAVPTRATGSSSITLTGTDRDDRDRRGRRGRADVRSPRPGRRLRGRRRSIHYPQTLHDGLRARALLPRGGGRDRRRGGSLCGIAASRRRFSTMSSRSRTSSWSSTPSPTSSRSRGSSIAIRRVWVCGLAEMWAPFFWLVGGRGHVRPRQRRQMRR